MCRKTTHALRQAALIGFTFAVLVPVLSVGMAFYFRCAGGGDVREY